MKVSFRETIEIPADCKADIFAFAGSLGVYKHRMGMRDAIKAIMAQRGVNWVSEMMSIYPEVPEFPPKAKRVRVPAVNGTSGAKRRKKKDTAETEGLAVSS